MRRVLVSLLCLAAAALPGLPQSSSSGSGNSALANCGKEPVYRKLDFWVGRWEVFDNASKTKDGNNTIERILQGCALVENWRDVEGHEGKSLFYYQRATKLWKQVWVTDQGPMKEKRLVEELKDGGVRFQGEIPHFDGTSHLDRTTLTPLSGGRVHQVIEISKDGGKTWQIGYDAEYRPVN